MKNYKLCIVLFSFAICSVSTYANTQPTYSDISYGPDPLNKLDLWIAKSEKPTPLVIYIHGGGWINGDKTDLKKSKIGKYYLPKLLEKGISFASINYRLNKNNTQLPTPVHDAVRAIQFLRYKKGDWNIDGDKFALWGGSAGACTSMWIAFHDDLADLDSNDPVLRESSRVSAVVSQNGQTSIDPKWIEKNIGAEGYKHPMIAKSVGESDISKVLENYDDYKDMFHEFSPINHLDKDDPPYFGLYKKGTVPAPNPGKGIHHGMFGFKLLEKSNEVGHNGHIIKKQSKYKDQLEFTLAIFEAK